MKIKKFSTETHLLVFGLLIVSGVAAVNPSFFQQSFTSILQAPDSAKSVVENSSTETPVQTNVRLVNAKLDRGTQTLSVTIAVTNVLPDKPFIISAGDDRILVSPGKFPLDTVTTIAVPLTKIIFPLKVTLDPENFLTETTKSDNTLVVLDYEK